MRRIVVVVVWALLAIEPLGARAEGPFSSAGFIKFPAMAEVGAVSAVAVDHQDRIYVLQRGEPPLLAFDAKGEFLRGWGQGMFKVPHGLRVDREGNVWTTDNGNHVLRKFSPEGKLLGTLGIEGKPSGGNEGFRSPDDLVFDSAGNIYVADSGNGRIVKLAADGKFLAEWGSKGKQSGQFATAHGLAIDKEDRIYVADRGNKRVQVFDSAGKHLANWSGFGNPFGLLVVGSELLVSEGDIHKIIHVDREGKVATTWGDPESLKLPHLMAINSQGTLLIAEVNGKRVQMFTRSSAAAQAAAARVDAEVLSRIPKRMQEFVEAGQVSGVVTLVAHQGKIVHEGAVGEADVEAHRPMRPDSLFAVASMTKPITATAVMILAEEKKLSLDDPASKYIPESKQAALASGSPQREITIRDLLTHTSGLVGEQRNEGTLQETAIKMSRRPLGFEPGTKWQYSPGLTICGRIVEVASGQAYEKFLAARIFEPLGMADTTFFPTAEQQKRLARLYQPGKDGKPFALAPHWLLEQSTERTANPSGGLYSTARDLARFYQMILKGGELDGKRIVSPAGVTEMTRVQTGDLQTGFTPGNGWGLGWCVVREPQGVSRMLSQGSFGHGGAFGTQGWIDPPRQMIFVLLVQRTGFGNSDGSAIREVFQQLAVDAVVPTEPITR